MNILVISPHPDDEVLGMGGTIKKLSKKNRIILCVVSEGATAQYKDKKMIQVRKNACKKCSKILGISKTIFLDFPDMRLNLSHLDINKKLEEIIKKFKQIKLSMSLVNYDLRFINKPNLIKSLRLKKMSDNKNYKIKFAKKIINSYLESKSKIKSFSLSNKRFIPPHQYLVAKHFLKQNEK